MRWEGSSNPRYIDGRQNHPLRRTWWNMLMRCENPRFPAYARYGGRGVTVCERWHDFALFVEDVGERPPGKTIDRLDSSKGYEPGNWRWATATEQSRNRPSYNVLVTLDGVTKLRRDWCAERGIHESKIRSRVRRGMTYEEAFR